MAPACTVAEKVSRRPLPWRSGISLHVNQVGLAPCQCGLNTWRSPALLRQVSNLRLFLRARLTRRKRLKTQCNSPPARIKTGEKNRISGSRQHAESTNTRQPRMNSPPVKGPCESPCAGPNPTMRQKKSNNNQPKAILCLPVSLIQARRETFQGKTVRWAHQAAQTQPEPRPLTTSRIGHDSAQHLVKTSTASAEPYSSPQKGAWAAASS